MTSDQLRKRLSLAIAPVAFSIFSACGGGGGGGIGIADGGIRGTGSSVGPVSGFGSVFVNGVKFETSNILNRRVENNDGLSSEDDLEKGMILRVEGQWSPDGTGTAESLEYDDTFRGTAANVSVTKVDSSGAPETGTFIVLGQTISFDRRTVIRLDNEFADASALEGKLVRISAWPSVDSYRASYIGELDTLPENLVELEGLGRYDSGDLLIGTQRIIVPGDRVFADGLTADAIGQTGQRIEVEGEYDGAIITARTIRPADDRRYEGQEGEDIEITGTVSGYTPRATSFFVNGVDVSITSDTEFDDLDRDQLTDNMLVTVEGDFRDGIIVAEEVELFEGNADVEASVIKAGRLPDSWDIGGVIVVLTNSTVIEFDDGLSSISPGVSAEVEGIERTGNDGKVFLEALTVEVESDISTEYELTGRIDRAYTGSGSIKVLGLVLDNTQPVPDCDIVEVEYLAGGSTGYVVDELECAEDDDD
ncbi:MAG: hypothetical protein HLX50_11330 [Alteromonadaceae bacterium]|nr:hypothetical protein [Alteromonadaceae bacterium]